MLLKKYLKMREHLKNHWLSPDKLAEIQNAKLKKIINHAYNNVPYYHNLFSSVGLKPADIQSVQDLKKIPITYKEDINKFPITEVIGKGTDLKSCIHGRTSGSTGVPLQIILSVADLNRHQAVWNSILHTCGRKVTDKTLIITSRFPLVYKKRWYEYLKFARNEFLTVNQDTNTLIQSIEKINPDIILCYPTRMFLIAKVIRREGVKGVSPRILITTSETLSKHMREYINETFNLETIDYYGSWETGAIAWECQKHEGYHINSDTAVVELIKDNKNVEPGELGEIVITSLISYTMPFIRYNLKDIGISTNKLCSCGRGLPMLEKIEGRTDELIVLPSGELLSPRSINVTADFEYIEGIEEFQVVQEDKDRIVVLLIIKHKNCNEIVKTVEYRLRELIRENIDLEIKVVEEIPITASGKRQSVISKVKLNLN